MNKKITIISVALASLFAFGSCKPKQSAYKSVYESAKERDMYEDKSEAKVISKPTSRPTQSTSKDVVRREKITPVYEADASGLKAYSVVIAAMGMKPNAESLKKRIDAAGYKTILVQNDQGMYRVIIGSYDTKDRASSEKGEILSDFLSQEDQVSLKAKYGIPFDDWWILQRDY